MNLDLVEVAPKARPPVCKIMDYSKLQYEKKRKAKEAKKKSRQVQLKEVKFRPAIDQHDFETKVKRVRKFLKRGDKVKLTLMFRGRQIVHSELGEDVLRRVIESVEDIGEPEGRIKRQGRFMGALLVAKPESEQEKSKQEKESAEE